jgi:hypothetical protein
LNLCTFLTLRASLADCVHSSEHLCTWQHCAPEHVFAHSDLFSFYRAFCPAEHRSTWGTCAFSFCDPWQKLMMFALEHLSTWGTCAFG